MCGPQRLLWASSWVSSRSLFCTLFPVTQKCAFHGARPAWATREEEVVLLWNFYFSASQHTCFLLPSPLCSPSLSPPISLLRVLLPTLASLRPGLAFVYPTLSIWIDGKNMLSHAQMFGNIWAFWRPAAPTAG